ncbi:beta-ketoacyl synthase N-terminal-like domain-containing protein [Streptomyces sp. NPDC046853]|uniref:beta-ketoacyl synthase N-terminal-like domain-containing protein n=1 Tax=Streptomyces sp. NPDC046853 TaxID=3154920 RepID=UPI0033FD305B
MSDTTATAVVGIDCRFPDARGPREFWRNIAEGRVAVHDLDPALLRAAGLSDEQIGAPDYVKRGAGIAGAADFAAEFFGYTPGEADSTDPQQRIFLETCWGAMEAAGHAPRDTSLTTGVFAGGGPSTYMTALQVKRAQEGGVLAAADDVALHLGGLADYLPSRVAYKLGLRGPSIGVQTACSSALTAVHYATLSLLAGECDLALAGGACVGEPLLGYRYQPGGLQSRDGYCRPFDAMSTGTAFSSGVGVVALRRLDDALADGDPILAVIRGTAVGNDGRSRSGFTAPSPAGVARVIAAALGVAGLPGARLRYVEAHGSGTPLGDQIELRGLTEGLRSDADPGSERAVNYCGLGSVKANIGHCGPAAGIAGLIKAIQVTRTGLLPPHPFFERPRSPGVLAESPFTISAEGGAIADGERHVLVNSMGLGGTNAAVVIGPSPAPTRQPAAERGRQRLVLSARTRNELDALSALVADALEQTPGNAFAADVAHTLRVGRTRFGHRRVVAASPDLLPAALREPAPATPSPARRLRILIPASQDEEAARPVVDEVTRVLTGPCETVIGRSDTSDPDDCFTIVIGAREPAPGQYAISPYAAPAARADQLDEAATAAWLHGVTIDWDAMAKGRGRRVGLPVYPFTRTRHWALDRLPPLVGAVAPPAGQEQDRPRDTAATTPTTAPELADPYAQGLLHLWRELFGEDGIGPEDEFAALGGDSLTAMLMEAEIERRHGVTVDVHRVGGGQMTVRRLAAEVTTLKRAADGTYGSDRTRPSDTTDTTDTIDRVDMIDTDLALSLGRGSAGSRARTATDTLLTSVTSALDAFVLHELLAATDTDVHCVVHADTEAEARSHLRTRARLLRLPEPDPARVPLLLGDPTAPARLLAGYDSRRIGHVVHRVEPTPRQGSYAELRGGSVRPLADLLTWMRAEDVGEFSCLSSLSACGPALGADRTVQEHRQQPLRPDADGAATAAWVGERLLERAEADGMSVRVFRTGLLLGATDTGACDPSDPLWGLLAASLAGGVYPREGGRLAVVPVDLAARAIARLSRAAGAVGRAYHVCGGTTVGLDRLCKLTALAADRELTGVSETQWHRTVATFIPEGIDALLRRYAPGGDRVEATGRSAWPHGAGDDFTVTAEQLWRAVQFAAARNSTLAGPLSGLLSIAGRR